MNKPLTQKIVDTTPAPKTGFKELRERGLVLRVSATGGKSWSFEYRSPLTKKSARISFPATSLADARAIVHRHRVALTEGKDPSMEKKEVVAGERVAHARLVNVQTSLAKYEPGFLADAPLKQASRRDRMHRLRRVLATFMDRAVSSLTQPEMILFLDELAETSGPVARNRAHAEICAWLGWARLRAHAPTNVLDRVPKVKEASRKRVLTDAELAAMMSATTDGSTFSDYVRVLLHTAMRRDEGASMQPRWLDFDARTITIPAAVAKNVRDRMIPMAEAIAPMLKARANGLAPDGYIFGDATLFRSPFQGWHKPTERLRAVMPPSGEGEGWTLHDIRRTVSTRMHKAKVPTVVVEDFIGHVTGERKGVAGVYNLAEFLDEQRAALAEWADKLASLTNVVALKRVA